MRAAERNIVRKIENHIIIMKTFNSILMTLAVAVSPVVANAAEPF